MTLTSKQVFDFLAKKNIAFETKVGERVLSRPVAWNVLEDAPMISFYKGMDVKALERVSSFSNCLIVTSTRFKGAVDGPFVFVESPQLAFLYILREFFTETKTGIHPSALIHEEAVIGTNAFIGPGAIIGKSVIGNDCIIEAGAQVCDGVTIGNGFFLNHGAVVGSWAPGSLVDENDENIIFPQVGALTIGDHVFIGTNAVIHIGALSDTVLEDNVHIAGNCLVGHNCVLRKSAYLAPSVNLAGGVHIGAHTYLGIGTTVKENITIAARITIGMNCQIERHIHTEDVTIKSEATTRNLGKMFSLKRSK